MLASPDMPDGATLVVPLGSVEQHGAHLPLTTDTDIACAVASHVAREIGACVAPAVAYGSSGEHQDFAGTVSIGSEVLRTTLIELVRSARTWATRVVFVNGHGGNVGPVSAAVKQLRTEGHDVSWFACAVSGADAHAGRTETSLMLYLRPDTVNLHRAEAGDIRPLADIIDELRSGGVRAISANGVLGDPRQASASEGERLLTQMVTGILQQMKDGARG